MRGETMIQRRITELDLQVIFAETIGFDLKMEIRLGVL